MRKRNERRSSIETAFEHLRTTVATALGAAENELERVRASYAQREFAQRIAAVGLARAERDPSVVCDSRDLAFDGAMQEARSEREQIFTEWSGHGPDRLAALVAEAAPGTAGRPWQDWLGEPGTAEASSLPPQLWRIGTGQVPASPDPRPFPVAVPMIDEAHLRITSNRQNLEARESLVQNLVLRMLSHYKPGLVRVHVWDVAQLTGTLPGLYPLTNAGLLTAHDPTRLGEMLEELSDHIRRIHTSALNGGHISLRALAEDTGQRDEPWRIAVLFGDGEPLREEQQQQLQRVARNGLACGIQLIVADLPMTVNSSVESVTLHAEEARTSMTGPEAVVRLDAPPSRELVTKACSAIATEFVTRRSRVRTFADLVPETLWVQRSASGLQAPAGFHEGEPVKVTLGDASPHTLIGGPSGSGKTNFLYSMLGGMVARYSPDELELYLLDFKEGVSFAQFTPGRRDPTWLPHAQLVGVNVNEDREFGLALLRFLATEMRRRADAAKAHEVTKLEELRAENPSGRWPRIVAVIDEFQYLFAERDTVSAQATSLLEDVARRGRSQGIHLVLASQDVSGIEAFWGKPAIFEQFILRIALPKARRVLADQNEAALALPRWHAVINHESGVKHGNEVARIPDATAKGTFDELQRRLWERRQEGAAPPRLFDGSLLPALSELPDFTGLTTGAEAPVALLGQVIDVNGTAAAVRMERSPGRNLAVIGSVRVDAVSVLGAAALSLARQHDAKKARFTVLGLVEEVAPDVEQLKGKLEELGHETDVRHGVDAAVEVVGELARKIDDRSGSVGNTETSEYVLFYGVDAAHSAMEKKGPDFTSGLDHLRKLLKQGPEQRVHVLGWWRSAQRVKTTLMGPVDEIGAWVAFDVHGQELSSFAAGQLVHWSPRARRGLFFDRSVHSQPEVVLPFDLAGALAADIPEEDAE
ncbi:MULTISPECIES: FtsK/SpoIIIE domain-containing protein [unclassified Saccharopolyspora]|uniref:FtsK/SpoIIIE domain-containing protein n=1 Tax=unclassified Saccharopolyspora TaxID=2646250 RepID=UPI001CD283F7|nr:MULTISPECIES: FtsK/SpoIIIE domain-containing protein [unclassified Saccharopolyspora]MCA1189151.1 cell division protein FtsK [Saccharopolyspora sp. 6T]MCA1191168.1 cell division protein FtsK [Saccharopolyspora sp. 6V]MCA1225702.1 cell division protein FtsK [Saccharopolyspora sp. 6M]MCA1283116.1 cell division protein FtsK [Saccharopolyspora sp. 7B]